MIVFLCNGEKWRHIGALRKLALRHGYRYYITDSVSDVGKVLAKVSEDEIKVICVLGGDGTVCQLITPILYRRETQQDLSAPPAIAVLGGGTMNQVFGYLNLSGSPEEIAKQVIENFVLGNLQTKKIPTLRVEFGGRVVFGFLFVLGPIVKILEEYTKRGRSLFNAAMTFSRGVTGATIGWPASFRSFLKPMDGEIIVDGKKLAMQNTYAILSSTITRIVFGFHPFLGDPRDVTKDGEKFYTIVTSMSPPEVILRLLQVGFISTWQAKNVSLLTSWLPSLESYFNAPIGSMMIETDEEIFTVDGEIFKIPGGGKIKIIQGPEVELMCPLM